MKEKIEIDIFCDEIKENSAIGPDGSNEKWIYLGIMLIPLRNKIEIFNNLMKLRCRNENNWYECNENCSYHKKNGSEIHYQNIKSGDVFHIAKKWINFFSNDSNIYFYMLGINLSRLNLKSFGNKRGNDRFEIIYNRFFRTALKRSINYFFRDYRNITIRKIYHDNASIQNHEYFPWHSIFKLENEIDNLRFDSNEIIFLDSDYEKSKDRNSHFIQLTDLILGLIFNNFHLNARNKKALDISSDIKPILERIINNPYNKNSRYNYYRRFDFGFFPKYKLKSFDGLENEYKRMDSFYRNRELKIGKMDQIELFEL